ncbi:MAG: response regulator [Melioribacteraceae bacterium]|nr:response regulator [Melioribacteraceae bacterium]MCF8354182.1 response regulator [Melioribacteraceae bacterium]MCF8394720.1 response regulator [Melioribacteraceae bacterium]MCF8418105.1 response regulator [Melioribacteraceae bacterium]
MAQLIFVIDDEDNIRENIKEILAFSGFDVVDFPNAISAIDYMEEVIPDLIISDVMMPGINGLEFLERIKQNNKTLIIPFIYLTARSTYKDLRKGMAAGADDYLFKPFKAEDLLNTVKVKLAKKNDLNNLLDEVKLNIALSVPHELRTPLTPILGFSTLLSERADSLTSEQISEMSKSIKSSSLRLHSRIEKFLLFSSIQLDFSEPFINPKSKINGAFNISEKVQQVVYQKLDEYKRRNDVIMEIENENLKINESHLSICINELADNACKFSDAGSKIAIKGIRNDNYYMFSFQNNGKGFTADQIKRINILNKSFDYSKDGSGLGLPIVKQIIEYYGGEFNVESEPGVATDIKTKIPVAEKIKMMNNKFEYTLS